MSYLTQLDLIKNKLVIDGKLNTSAMIKDLIESDRASEDKKEMNEGVNYYKGVHDITKRKIYYYKNGVKVVDETKTNNKLVNAFHRLLVDQKSAYIIGKGIKFTTEDEDFQNAINDELNDWFQDILAQWIKGASNKGIEYVHLFLDENGKLDYTIIPGEQIIPVYDSQFQKELMYIIRYYIMEVQNQTSGKFEMRYKVEWWDNEKVEFFIETENGHFILDPDEPLNPRYHWIEFNTNKADEIKSNSWGKIPFIALPNNDYSINDLKAIKALIDVYDIVESDFSNNFQDLQDAVYVLKGYQGTDLGQFVNDLRFYKAVKTDEDGGVDSISFEIPYQARKELLDRIENNIYELGQGVNMSDEIIGNASGVALRYKYSGLDLKAGNLIRKLKYALKEFMWFLTKYINMRDGTNYDYEAIRFDFNLSMLINEGELIDNITKSIGLVSKETLLKKHPFVEDVGKEMVLIEKENEGKIDLTIPDDNQPIK